MIEYLYKPYTNKQYADFVVANKGRKLCKDDEKVWFEDYEIPSLEELKTKKRAEVNAARDAAEQGGFEYMGKIFDSDPISCQRISCAAQAMQISSLSEVTPTITWTCQDNTTIDLNPSELLGLVGALAAWSNSCHIKATKLKDQIGSCQSAEDLAQIVWDNGE